MEIMARIIDKFGVKTAVCAVNEYNGKLYSFVTLGGIRYKVKIYEPYHPSETSPKFWMEVSRHDQGV